MPMSDYDCLFNWLPFRYLPFAIIMFSKPLFLSASVKIIDNNNKKNNA